MFKSTQVVGRIIRSPILKVALAFPLIVYAMWDSLPHCEWLSCRYDFFFEEPGTLLAILVAAWLLISAFREVIRRLLDSGNPYQNVEMPTPADQNEVSPPRIANSGSDGFGLPTNDA